MDYDREAPTGYFICCNRIASQLQAETSGKFRHRDDNNPIHTEKIVILK